MDHLFAISGRSEGLGTVVWSARPIGGPSNSGGYGEYCLAVAPDLTGDGTHDVLYGAAWGNRSAFLLDGTSGQTVWSFDTYEDSPPAPPRSGWVYAVASLGSDVTGAILWSYAVGDKISTVRGVPDLTGNGIPDVVAGTQLLNGSGGICYAFEGNDDVAAGVADPAAFAAGRLRVAPNPSAGPTLWSFPLARGASRAVIELHDPSGRRVRTLDAGPGGSGEAAARWDGRCEEGRLLPAGIYLGRLLLNGRPRAATRMVRLPR